MVTERGLDRCRAAFWFLTLVFFMPLLFSSFCGRFLVVFPAHFQSRSRSISYFFSRATFVLERGARLKLCPEIPMLGAWCVVHGVWGILGGRFWEEDWCGSDRCCHNDGVSYTKFKVLQRPPPSNPFIYPQRFGLCVSFMSILI